MCKKCNYRVREILKNVMSENPEECFLQKGLNSKNPGVQILARSAMRAVFSDMTLDEFVKRLYDSLKNNAMEQEKQAAYKEFLVTVPGFDKIDEESPEYKKEVFGGLID